MENLIYILIGIAWVAYSLYSARQKAIQKQQSAGRPPKDPSQSLPLPVPESQTGGKTLFDDILRELTGESRPIPQVIQPVGTPEPVSYQKSSTKPESFKKSTRYSLLSDLQTDFPLNESEEIRKTQIQSDNLTQDEHLLRGFSLRKAVIYSELLNRKYF